MGLTNILYSKNAIDKQYGYYERPVFNGEQRAGKGINSEADWVNFKMKFNPFITIDLSPYLQTELEMLITDKDVSWGTRDANIWIGSDEREINEVDDFTQSEAEIFFGVCLNLCRNLNKHNNLDHSISIGFNLGDIGLPGHHNVRRLHAHLRAYNDPYDLEKIEQRNWRDMHWFDRLTFVEPFTPVYFDFINHLLTEMPIGGFDNANIQMSDGVIDIPINKNGESSFPALLINLYSLLKAEHRIIEQIFTSKELDPETNRYIPHKKSEIEDGLKEFFTCRPYYSNKSQNLLNYLGRNILQASKRPDSRDQFIIDSSHVYITKGFAGALTIRHSSETDRFILEFLPRVLTSSAVAKTMFGRNKPTIMGKHVPATEYQIKKLTSFKDDINREIASLIPIT